MFVLKSDNESQGRNHPAFVRLKGRRRFPHGGEQAVEGWAIPNETAVEVRVNGEPLAVMMATPADLEEFAVGFALTEGIAPGLDAIEDLTIENRPQGVVAALTVSTETVTRRERGLEGRSGCGICGVRSLDDAMRCVPAVTARDTVTSAAIHHALDATAARQKLNAITRAVHAAAWCDRDGRILALREDVGRHNALDKLAGWMALGSIDPLTGFAVITSRCSYEMVQKAAMMDIGTIVAISAPTALAVSIAREAGMTLAAVARADSHILLTGQAHDSRHP